MDPVWPLRLRVDKDKIPFSRWKFVGRGRDLTIIFEVVLKAAQRDTGTSTRQNLFQTKPVPDKTSSRQNLFQTKPVQDKTSSGHN